MAGSAYGSDDDGPLQREPRIKDSSKNQSLREALQRSGPAPSGRTQPPDPLQPWTRRGRGFEGPPPAPVDLRSRMPQERYDTATRGLRDSSRMASGNTLRYGGLFLAVAAVAGVAGYLAATLGVSTRSTGRVASPAAVATPALRPAADRERPSRSLEPRAASQPAAIPDSTAPHPAKNADAVAVTALQSAPPPEPARPAEAPEETAAKMKLGADLLASGDIFAARVMFERVAEAGDAAGAFALAETYDPVVLNAMHLRGGIAPDPVQALRWYEKARDLGSSAAPERITRLTGR